MYNFDQETNRFNTTSYKWDVKDNELPMWVADMDFETAPCIIDALQNRLDHHIFGYNTLPDEYYQSIINWWHNHHHFDMNQDEILFSTGVVPTISSVVRKVTNVAENVLIMSPVYNIFYNSIINNGRNIVSSDLVYEDGQYHIDFDDLDKKLSNPQTTLMIFCNPHNPIGKIWDKDTLIKVGKLCQKHHVIVLSDEIHCDITAPNREYIPYASVNDVNKNHCIMAAAPTKCFNLAGMQTSFIYVYNPVLRHKVWRGINTDEIAEPNSFAVCATTSAFNQGKEWLDAMRDYVEINKKLVNSFVKDNLPMLHVVASEATYLLWIDCSKVCEDSVELTTYIREHTGLYLSDGLEYGENGKAFIRMNVATQKSRVIDGLNRFKEGIELYINEHK